VKLASRSSSSALPVPPTRPLLSVVVPVYNGGEGIVENVDVIRRAVSERVNEDELELIVVSDGSIDGTAERLIESRGERLRVIHYDRNLGKGYAVKAGALASRGSWVALVDADLDLDPHSVGDFLDVARREQLDFAIGSKRHPESVVRYPRSRRVASWLYQQLNRILFRLDVRDTQVGLKVFSRDVVDDVVPLLLVKRFAFDLELLAVATALGHDRIRELPVRLEYRFAGSALGSGAVLRALWDTAAIFYRLRILRTYQRKQRLVAGSSAAYDAVPVVSIVGDVAAEVLDYAQLEVVHDARDATGEIVAVLPEQARPAGNWLAASVAFFADPHVAAVVVPTVTPLRVSVSRRAAAAVLESRLGGGSRRTRHFPGNVRVVTDYPAAGVVVRRSDYLAALDAGVDAERLVAWLHERDRLTIYTPDTSVSAVPPPVFRPHLRATLEHARARGTVARRGRGTTLSVATALSLLPAACAVAGLVLLFAAGGVARDAGAVLVLAYAACVAGSALLAATRFRSLRAGLLVAPALVATQAVYVAGFVRGFLRPR
jgi:glycosyltransferase involved in cell wall biosynthesis